MTKVITISGLDGSGKSTQIELLQQHLESKGKKVKYFHAIQFSLPNKIIRTLKGNESKSDSTDDDGKTAASKPAIWLRQLLLPIDQFRFKRYINKLNAKGYDYLLSDRYFYDSAVNIVYLGGSKNVLKRTFPPTEASFFLNVNPEEIMSRERAPGQGIEYLKTKNTLYAQLMKHQNMTPIDGSEDPTTINQTIIQRL